ncbi:glycosyltransferase [Bradyrhizobium sp. UNPF46]|uniref:glycosyltransferase n=1 Tax=Bradyrhizobium sp. UNPF46 TaxID=1141168 RepID=UPI0011530F86|nr:glycosyltransferase [Bradyrhizobium sp. UNPF46]
MNPEQRSHSVAESITLIAPFPPPVTGQSAYSVYLSKALGGGWLECLFLPGRDDRDGMIGYWRKVRASMGVLLRLLLGRRRRRIFIVLDGGVGLLFDLLFLLALRLRGVKKIILSHHSFAYIDQNSLLMRLVVVVTGRLAIHAFLCDRMKALFGDRYGIVNGYVLSNARRSNLAVSPLAPAPRVFTIGYLSNISFEKGIAEFFGLLDELAARNLTFEAKIAGPAISEEVANFVNERISRCRHPIIWVGPLYGDEKEAFFSSLSAFAFPTNYINEAQPNVLFESLSHGVPVVSIAKGCISDDMLLSNSFVAPSREVFIDEAAQHIESLMLRYEKGEADLLRRITASRFAELYESSQLAEARLFRYLQSDTAGENYLLL